ncbi:unnamed protein product [Polarella glacialis]|uniref:Homing endonuclease LAGLIDADG domain-containing protein n=1 Tax=Polarella glacialis TaxID=89957 RepID=A0A813G4Z5_POLGL|nr:unnamed protein product [Polarella glacialis]
MRKLHWAPVNYFIAEGQRYQVPWRAPSTVGSILKDPDSALSDEELQYLVGFFDGDGSVFPAPDGSCCVLSVGQSYTRGEALLRFSSAFGGAVYKAGRGKGLWKPMVQWTVRGAAGKLAARTLSQLPSMKQAQLQLAANWPSCRKERGELAVSLKLLKQPDHKPELYCSWAFMAGFFDAEGYIRIRPLYAGVNLQLVQKNRSILDCIHVFLQVQQPGQWSTVVVYDNGIHRISCNSTRGSQQALEHMLQAGLSVKRREAELALMISPSNHVRIREDVSRPSGNQSKHRRLDESGMLRAMEIHRIGDRLRKARASNPKVCRLQEDLHLQQLKMEHKKNCRLSVIGLLRNDIRQLLAQGASVNQTDSEKVPSCILA